MSHVVRLMSKTPFELQTENIKFLRREARGSLCLCGQWAGKYVPVPVPVPVPDPGIIF